MEVALSDCPECWDTPCTCSKGHLGSKIYDYTKLEAENAELKRKLEKAMSLIKKAQNIERDRVREECGNPGFDGPMTIATWMDETLKEIEGNK